MQYLDSAPPTLSTKEYAHCRGTDDAPRLRTNGTGKTVLALIATSSSERSTQWPRHGGHWTRNPSPQLAGQKADTA